MARKAFRLYGDFPNLMAVPAVIRKKVMPEVVKDLTEVAKEEAPKRRGTSSGKSIVSRIKGTVEAGGFVGHIRSLAPHSHLIEFGVNGHSLAPKRKRKRNPNKVVLIPGTGYRHGAMHRGHGKNPFMERTEAQGVKVSEKALFEAATKALAESITKVDLP